MPIGQPPFPPPGGLPIPQGPIGGAIATLAERPQESADEKVRRAIALLDEAREEDPKLARVLSMAIHVLRNGEMGSELFEAES